MNRFGPTPAHRRASETRQPPSGIVPTRRDVLAMLALLAAGGPRARAQPVPMRYRLALLDDQRVPFRGLVRHDDAGLPMGSMLYPAPNLIGLLAAVITHAAIVEGEKSAQKTRMQEMADKVLEPYRPTLESYLLAQLREQSAPALAAFGVDAAAAADSATATLESLESVPLFAITPDEAALVLDNTLRIAAKEGGAPGASVSVRVVSAPLPAADEAAEPRAAAPGAWTDDEGRRLKTLCAELFAESIGLAMIALDPPARPAPAAMRTIRYMQGRAEQIERAELIAARPGRLVLRTLRGHLLSVPERTAAPAVTAASGPAA